MRPTKEFGIHRSRVYIKVKCPMCGATTFKESIDAILKEIEKLWKPWKDALTPKLKKRIEEYNNKERLEKILAEEGYLTMFCPVCRLLTTIEVEERLRDE